MEEKTQARETQAKELEKQTQARELEKHKLQRGALVSSFPKGEQWKWVKSFGF